MTHNADCLSEKVYSKPRQSHALVISFLITCLNYIFADEGQSSDIALTRRASVLGAKPVTSYHTDVFTSRSTWLRRP